MKVCSKCNIEKPLDDFYLDKRNKSGVTGSCKPCYNLNQKKWKESNLNKVKEIQTNWRKNNREKVNEIQKKYYKNNLEIVKESSKKWKKNNPDKVNENKRNYYKNNPEKIKESNRIWVTNNADKVKNKTLNWVKNNPDKVKEIKTNWRKNNPDKIKENRRNQRAKPEVKICNSVRRRMWDYLNIRNITKKNKTFEIVGCSPQFLKEHLEKQFTQDMSWDNYGFYGWHIDHIIPLSSAKTEEEIYKLCHYSNLQPLWAQDNWEKNNKILVKNII